jgi:hypothetical protein
MPTYAYRWIDGSVSVCSANDIDEAMTLFDQIAPVSRKLIIELDAPVLFTVKPKSAEGWKLDPPEFPLGEELDSELLRTCYPNLDEVISNYFEVLDSQDERAIEEYKKQVRKALRRDKADAKERQKLANETPEFIAMFPHGFLGQNN